MLNEQGLQQLTQTKIMAIARGVNPTHIIAVAEALLAGGISVMEVTLNTPDACYMINQLQSQLGNRMYIGAGTVIDLDGAHAAVEAGASFLVSPNTDEEVIRWARSIHIPIFPGAMTPTEIIKAWKAGATAVKVFPSASLGLPYLKELMAPLDHIPMIAVGGVNETNIKQYIDSGCYCVGIGGSLINMTVIANHDYAWITEKARRLIEASH